MFGGFGNDPFFGDINNHFANMHNQMMSPFMMDPFAHMRAHRNAIAQHTNNGRSANNNNGQQQQRSNSHNQLMDQQRNNPFALMNSMMSMSPFGGAFGGFESMMSNMNSNPNAQVYSSSTVMSYSNDGSGKPKIYQATEETKQVGGVKETRKAVKDTEKGIEKVAIGHHIGEKAHIIERQRQKGGQMEEIVNMENLDEDEVNDFNREFEERIQHGQLNRYSIDSNRLGHSRSSHHHNPNYNQPLAIDDGSRKRDKKKSKSKHNK